MYDLQRFIDAQRNMYQVAYSELVSGQKYSHWMWYIFPQVKGLGQSYNSEFYGIDGIDEAKEFIKNDLLRVRLLDICDVILSSDVSDIYQMFPYIDGKKLKSSMTLFEAAAPEYSVFHDILEKYYDGKRCKHTLSLISSN